GGLGLAAEVVDVLGCPQDKQANFSQRGKGEAGGPADALVEQDCRAAAGLAEQLATATVRGDQRRLGRRQGNVVVALREQAIDTQRTGQSDGNLHSADEVLDVVLVLVLLLFGLSIEQLLAAGGGDQLPAPFDGLVGEVRAARDLRGRLLGLRGQ